MSTDEIFKVYSEGIESVISLVKELTQEVKSQTEEIKSLQEENKKLNQRVEALENQKKTNSNNSSKPPSSDGFNKRTKSLRSKSGKKPGGQVGHKGTTLELSDNPDEIHVHTVEKCSCGASLKEIPSLETIRRQIIDLFNLRAKIIEHQTEVKQCPVCNQICKGQFPESVKHMVQYGEGIKAIAVYLNQFQLIPYKRMKELFLDLLNVEISEGSLVTFNQSCHENLEAIEQGIKDRLATSTKAVHFDETGIYIDKKRQWLHVTSNTQYTYYKAHEKRGKKATDDIGILDLFKGIAVHDCWGTYQKYTNSQHALCGAHILRELNGITELDKQAWAESMKKLLLEIKEAVYQQSLTTDFLEQHTIDEFIQSYHQIIKQGIAEDEIKNQKAYVVQRKRSKSFNLLKRLEEYDKQVLAFMYNFEVPFDNNLAERDLRMAKVKQKISGTFRSELGADAFTRIRGYISTARKQGKNVMGCIKSVFTDSPMRLV